MAQTTTRRRRSQAWTIDTHRLYIMDDLPELFARAPRKDIARNWVAVMVDTMLDEPDVPVRSFALALATVSRRLHGTRYDMEAMMPKAFTIGTGAPPAPARGSRGSKSQLRLAIEALAPGGWLRIEKADDAERQRVSSMCSLLRRTQILTDVRSYQATDGSYIVHREPPKQATPRKATT